MRDGIPKSMVALGAWGLLLGAASGCGQSRGAYTPSGNEARQALGTALAAWRDGQSPRALENLSPPVHPVDFQWQASQPLAGFEILKEEEAQESGKRFLVRLDLKKPAKATEARYVVLGRGPVWIYREEDYARVLNMDNNPRPPRPKRERGR